MLYVVQLSLLAIQFEFERESYTLPEDSGDTDIIIRKFNGMISEVDLRVMVDFDILNPAVIELGKLNSMWFTHR